MTRATCGCCGAGGPFLDGSKRPTEVLVWVIGRGWATNLCTGVATSDKVSDATWFPGESNARAALRAADATLDEGAYVVVTL